MAHEINTPLGVGITTISCMGNNLRDLEKDIKNDILTQEEFDNYLETLKEGVSLIDGSLKKDLRSYQQFISTFPLMKGGETVWILN